MYKKRTEGTMSYQDLKDHIRRGGTKAALILAMEATAINAQAQEQKPHIEDAKQDKIEQVVEKQPEYTSQDINLFDVVTAQKIKQDGEDYVIIGDAVITEDKLSPRKLKKEWKKDEKEAFKNAGQDQIQTDTLYLSEQDEVIQFASYSKEDKVVNVPFVALGKDVAEQSMALNKLAVNGDTKETIEEKIEMRNDRSGPAFIGIHSHENQHRINDKLGIYAPGLNPEQYAVLEMYDEIGANVADLNARVSLYQEKIASGVSKDEALKVFGDSDFKFYKEAVAKGLDPQSKEGKALMVTGTVEMWNRESKSLYAGQLKDNSEARVGEMDVATLTIGNEKELQKRINKIFDNIGGNKELGIKEPGKLSEYLPSERIALEPEVQAKIEHATKQKIGLDKQQREQISESLGGNAVSDKKKARDFIKILTGRKKPKQTAAVKKDQTKEAEIDIAAMKQKTY